MELPDPSHPASDELERFMRCELKRPERPAVVRHLLTGCPRCLAVTQRLWDFGDRAPREVAGTGAGEAGDGWREKARSKVGAS